MTDAAKRAAGEAAAALVQDGMRLGLGTGTTMRFAIEAIAARGLRITGVPTSEATARLARICGVTLVELDGTRLDLAIDGADEVERGTFRLIKGRGGALLREKIVAHAASRFVIVADEAKLVDWLGMLAPLPVEIEPFGAAATIGRIAALGGRPLPRDGRSDGNHVILDCAGFAPIRDPYTLERSLRAIPGVIATGLFLLPVERVILGRDDGSVREIAA